jgi:phage shock protein B
MEGFALAVMVPTIVFMTFVAPLWIFLHYRSRQRADASLSESERIELRELNGRAERMLERIETLEAILDVESPGWRRRGDPADRLAGGRGDA